MIRLLYTIRPTAWNKSNPPSRHSNPLNLKSVSIAHLNPQHLSNLRKALLLRKTPLELVNNCNKRNEQGIGKWDIQTRIIPFLWIILYLSSHQRSAIQSTSNVPRRSLHDSLYKVFSQGFQVLIWHQGFCHDYFCNGIESRSAHSKCRIKDKRPCVTGGERRCHNDVE